MPSNTNYNSINQPFAHQQRQELTKAEACLWKYALKAGKMKEKALKEAGYEVIRFTDKQVLKDIQNVIAEIENNIEEFERQDVGKFAKVHPQPPPAGDIAIAQVPAKKDILSSEE